MSALSASGGRSRAPDSATMTGSTTTGVPSGSSSSARATASMTGASPSMPILTASIAEVARDGADLLGHELGRHGMDAGDADGVLRGERGDGGRAVDARGGERLQVGLDAGAAAGVRPGDGEDDGDARQ